MQPNHRGYEARITNQRLLNKIPHSWPEKLLGFAEKFYRGGPRQQAGGGAALDQFVNGGFATVTVTEGPAVHIHRHELVSSFGFHVAGKLHGVIQSFFAVFQAILDAVANRLRDQPAKFRTECAANRIPAQRQWQGCLLIHHTPKSITRCRPIFGKISCPS